MWSLKSQKARPSTSRVGPFRRRNFMPGILMFAALAVVTLIIWVIALNRPPDVDRGGGVQPARRQHDQRPHPVEAGRAGDARRHDRGRPRQPGRHQDPGAQRQRPGRPGRGGGRAAARPRIRRPDGRERPAVREQPAGVPGSDPVRPRRPRGAAAVWLVAPCVELFQDQRPDNTVDFAIGTDFTELARSDDIEAVLSSLRPEATQPADPSLIVEDPQRGVLIESGCTRR